MSTQPNNDTLRAQSLVGGSLAGGSLARKQRREPNASLEAEDLDAIFILPLSQEAFQQLGQLQ
jgi:hypothetical protein